MGVTDPLAAALASAEPTQSPTTAFLMDKHYGKRPEVLETIRVMRRDRGFTYAQIADLLNQHDTKDVKAGSVKRWLKAQGIA